jgi:hypothetical protein
MDVDGGGSTGVVRSDRALRADTLQVPGETAVAGRIFQDSHVKISEAIRIAPAGTAPGNQEAYE